MDNNITLETNVQRAAATLRSVLIAIGWDPQPDDESPGLVVDFEPPYLPIAHAYAVVLPDLEVFVFYFHFGVTAERERRLAVSRFVSLANSKLLNGNFELDEDDGLVRFRSSLVFADVELSATLIRNLIRFAMNAVEKYAESLVDVIARGKDPESAFREAEATQ